MIVITGATGHTGNKIAELLIEKKEKVRVIGRSFERLEPLVEKGAEAIVGDQSDTQFLTKAFNGAESAYLLIPPKLDSNDLLAYYRLLGAAAVNAIRKSGVGKIVFLSSLGAEHSAGTGPVVGLHDVEKMLTGLNNTNIVFLRAGYFMENFLGNISLIKAKKINGGSMPPDTLIFPVATKDIAAKAADILSQRAFTGRLTIELFSQSISPAEITRIIGKKIGVPDLSYIRFSKEDAVAGMTGVGVSVHVAQLMEELAQGMNSGKIKPVKEDPVKPTAPTNFAVFVNDVFYPAYTNVSDEMKTLRDRAAQ